jgi:poly-gamma-glutamate synthesis protein (capsule biosynthesis protein)
MSRSLAFGLLLLGACAQQTPAPPVASEPPPAPPPICANPNLEGPMLTFSTPVIAGQAVTIAAVGDVLMHDPLQSYAAEQPEGFRALLARVSDLLQGADITFANLEGPAAINVYNTGREAKDPGTRYDGRVYSGYPMFNYHPSLVADLKASGVDVLLTANNHSLDRQSLGVDRTIEAIAAAGLPYTGTRHRDAMSAPWYAVTSATVAGKTWNVAWLGCTYGTNEIPDRNNQVLWCFEQQDEVLAEIRDLAARPDIAAVILAPHWGREYRHDPTDRQRKLAIAALEAGATAVIGTHPHVLEPFEIYRTSDGRETFVAYSLGNFISGQSSLARSSSVILLLALMPNAQGKLSLADVRFVPTRVVPEGGGHFVEAIDRTGAGQKARAHILEFLPAGNLHPPSSPYWTGAACAPEATS